MASNRAQSEIIGLVVIFGIVISAIALVTATGFAGLQDARHVESTNNGLRAFEILDENVDDLVSGLAPERTTEIKLADDRLLIGAPITITVEAERRADGTITTYEREVVPIEYDLDRGTRLTYVGGALIREEHSSAVMLRPPTLVLSDDVAIIPVLETRAASGQSVGGSQTVAVRTHLAETELVIAESVPHRVRITITSPHVEVWERYFEGLPCDSVTLPEPETVECSIDSVDSVYVTAVRVDVSVE